MASGAVEIDIANGLGYGGDFSRTPDGDLLKAVDAPTNPAASVQRLNRIVLTTPVLIAADGTRIGRPDDLFNPTFGAGAGAMVGEPSVTVVDGLRSRILNAIAADTSFASSPAPVVNVTDLGNGFVQVDISAQTTTGQLVTLPSMPLNVYGS